MRAREEEARRLLKKALKLLGRERSAIDIFFIGDAVMRRLNRVYRGKDKTTNVLSFSAPKNFPRPDLKTETAYLGEIYLNMGYIKKEGEDWRVMLIHGLLHLLGFDHEKISDKIRMQKLEKSIASSLGF
jgi:probable rRNA maturation factor